MSENPVRELPVESMQVRKRRGSSVLFALGLILWIAVFALGYLVVRHRKPLPRDSNARPEAIVVADLGAPSQSQSAAPAVSAWDPAGVRDFVFTERSGKKVTKADLLGHPWLVSFIFTRCAGPCPRVSSQMSDLQRLLKGTDVRLVTLTVDPDFDTTEVLSRYARAYGADPNRWLYLTGDKKKTYELIMDSFKMPVQEQKGADRQPGYEVLHSTNILLVNETGVVVQKYNANNEAEMLRLRRDLKPYLDKAHATAGSAR